MKYIPYLVLLFLLVSCKSQTDITKVHSTPADTVASSDSVLDIDTNIVSNVKFNTQVFNPSNNQKIDLSLTPLKTGKIKVKIVDEDGFHIKDIITDSLITANTPVSFEWDGKDEKGRIVPDEAYFPIITIKNEAGSTVFNPLLTSGGENIYATNITYQRLNQMVSYTLKEPSRILLRIGYKKGALLKTLIDMKPCLKGTSSMFWNGKDEDEMYLLPEGEKKASMAAFGYTLPTPHIITYGNEKQTHRQYRFENDTELIRKYIPDSTYLNSIAVSRHFTQPIVHDHSPKIKISFPLQKEFDENGVPILKEKALVRVEVDSVDAQYLDNQYEITFFLDKEYYAEEEVGYAPHNWLWYLNGVESGEHVLTVNVASYNDRIGLKSVRIKSIE